MADTLTAAIMASGAGRKPLREFRLIPFFDTDAKIVAAAQTSAGRLVLFFAMVAMSAGNGKMLAATGCAALVAYMPRWRAVLMPAATLLTLLSASLLTRGQLPSPATIVATITLFVSVAGLLAIAGRIGRRGPFAWPVTSLLVGVTALAWLGSSSGLPEPLRWTIWSVAATIATFVWFIAYGIVNVTGRQPQNTPAHLAMLHPFWGSTGTPFGKGAAFLRKFEAHTREELAITQIKAAKLLLWANLLQLALVAIDHAAASYGLPTLIVAIAGHAAGHPLGRLQSIASILLHFIHSLLSLAVMGHVFVALCRYAGFRIPRNTCRPLSARTISEFWNRYYYYFKELLVDFFFMPTFSRLQGLPPKARIFFATFCAAGFGNYVFHFYRDIHFVRELGWGQALEGSQTYAFYCLLLSAGIGCSQLFKRERRSADDASLGRLVASPLVIAFYCIVSIFDYGGRSLTLHDHFRFLFYILGVST